MLASSHRVNPNTSPCISLFLPNPSRYRGHHSSGLPSSLAMLQSSAQSRRPISLPRLPACGVALLIMSALVCLCYHSHRPFFSKVQSQLSLGCEKMLQSIFRGHHLSFCFVVRSACQPADNLFFLCGLDANCSRCLSNCREDPRLDCVSGGFCNFFRPFTTQLFHLLLTGLFLIEIPRRFSLFPILGELV